MAQRYSIQFVFARDFVNISCGDRKKNGFTADMGGWSREDTKEEKNRDRQIKRVYSTLEVNFANDLSVYEQNLLLSFIE